MTNHPTHTLVRTSPKGEGQKFVGRCIRCGKTGLPSAAALWPCENVKHLSDDEALIQAIEAPLEKQP